MKRWLYPLAVTLLLSLCTVRGAVAQPSISHVWFTHPGSSSLQTETDLYVGDRIEVHLTLIPQEAKSIDSVVLFVWRLEGNQYTNPYGDLPNHFTMQKEQLTEFSYTLEPLKKSGTYVVNFTVSYTLDDGSQAHYSYPRTALYKIELERRPAPPTFWERYGRSLLLIAGLAAGLAIVVVIGIVMFKVAARKSEEKVKEERKQKVLSEIDQEMDELEREIQESLKRTPPRSSGTYPSSVSHQEPYPSRQPREQPPASGYQPAPTQEPYPAQHPGQPVPPPTSYPEPSRSPHSPAGGEATYPPYAPYQTSSWAGHPSASEPGAEPSGSTHLSAHEQQKRCSVCGGLMNPQAGGRYGCPLCGNVE